MNANEGLGAIVGQQTTKEVIKMAKKEGLAIALIKNMTTWLRPGTLAKIIAERLHWNCH